MTYDVIVVGAGVAGGALSTSLARDGRKVLLIERDLYAESEGCKLLEPDRIVGELLQPGGYLKLVQLGLKDALEGIDAQSIYGYGIFLNEKRERIDYSEKDENENNRVAGRSFHNGKFLRRLRELALLERNITLIQGNVISLDKCGKTGRVIGVSYKSKNSDQIQTARATLTIACDGCASRLRRKVSPSAVPKVYSHFVGMLLNNVDLPYPLHGHVILADPAPLLFYPVSSTQVRCLIDIPKSSSSPAENRFDLKQYLLTHLLPQLPSELAPAFKKSIQLGNLRTMPNRVMPSTPDIISGAILLGDSFNMRHPLTGGGMTVALNDVYILRTLFRATPDLTNIEQPLKNFFYERKPLSITINILANALYSVFCATDDPSLVDMRIACFDYLAAGGRFTHDPMGLIGGIKPYPFLLVVHFFSVALYGCARAVGRFPTPAGLGRAWDLFKASFNIVKPLIDAEKLKPLCWIPISTL